MIRLRPNPLCTDHAFQQFERTCIVERAHIQENSAIRDQPGQPAPRGHDDQCGPGARKQRAHLSRRYGIIQKYD
ncbi:hypothetical protein Airi01_088380 [Actinoallomurus iriomotensis]|uniref:Uncharacterized protein n=1 Tax=Actinoallomurus iriomotensis TaxID=478107 RepID=A0A9W6VWA4_9ACTN|nr:hypothetical protein Airi01_088380 [Actinoallomurus iriomotensis]